MTAKHDRQLRMNWARERFQWRGRVGRTRTCSLKLHSCLQGVLAICEGEQLPVRHDGDPREAIANELGTREALMGRRVEHASTCSWKLRREQYAWDLGVSTCLELQEIRRVGGRDGNTFERASDRSQPKVLSRKSRC
jgi:hypothetical protein